MSIDDIVMNIENGKIPKIDDDIKSTLLNNATQSKRLRASICLSSPLDPIQELFSAIAPGSYIRPHLHEKAEEAIVALIGKFAVVEFSEFGGINDLNILNQGDHVIINKGIWHTLFYMPSQNSNAGLIYNPTTGPYQRDSHAIYAFWAPPEESEFSEEGLRRIMLRAKMYEKAFL